MAAAGASQTVFDHLDRQPIQEPAGHLQPEEFRGDIEFDDVSLNYPARLEETAVQVNANNRTAHLTFFQSRI